MQVSTTLSTSTLLDYSISTAPSPVQVSQDANHPSYATLTFVISDSGADATVSDITFVLPVGGSPEGADLTEDPKGIGAAVSDTAWQISPGSEPGTFVLAPANNRPIVVGDQGIAVVLANINVSTQVGTATITINETATSDLNQPAGTRSCALAVAKFPYGFYAGDLALASPMVAHGQPAVLSWRGSDAPGTTYTMLWGAQRKDVTTSRQWTSPPLTDTTTFMLEVQGTSPTGPVKVWFSVTEIVADPDITATSLHVQGNATIDGTLTVAAASFAMLGAAQSVGVGTHTASTDGFAVVAIPQLEYPLVGRTWATITITGGPSVSAMGGAISTYTSTDGGAEVWTPIPGSAMLPVPRGSTWNAAVATPSNETPVYPQFWWIPLGGGQSGA